MALLRPRVLVNFAVSIDGKIALSPAVHRGRFPISTHEEDHLRMHDLRADADAIVIGAGNLRVDDPDLALAPAERLRRRSTGEKEPMRIVVTRRGDGVSPDKKMFQPALGGPSLVFHSEEMPAELREQLARVATLIALGDRAVDPLLMLDWMARELGTRVVLCEGGGIIAGALFRARAVDQLFMTLVPRILGGSDAPTLAEGPGFSPSDVPQAALGAMERVGDELFLRYDFRW